MRQTEIDRRSTTDRPTERQTYGETDRQAERQTDRSNVGFICGDE